MTRPTTLLMALLAAAVVGCGDTDQPGAPDAMPAAQITSAACEVQADNVLRYDCTVTTDLATTVTLELAPEASEDVRTINSTSDTGTTHELTVWGLVANTTYEWRAVAGETVGDTQSFTTASLPSDVDLDFVIQGTAEQTEYILFNFGCQGAAFLVVASVDGQVVWYENISNIAQRAPSRINGFSVSPEGTVLVNIDHDYVVEYGLDGEVLFRKSKSEGDFAASPHHDIRAEGDRLWVVTGDEFDYPDRPYIMDGVYVLDRNTGAVVSQWDTRQIYDPTGTGGMPNAYWMREYPNGVDYLHANALWVDADGDYLVSSRTKSAIVKINGDPQDAQFGELIWSLVGTDASPFASDFTITGSGTITDQLDFSWQHHVTITDDGYLRLFDNRTAPAEPSRVIELDLDTEAMTAEIVAEYPMDEKCRAQSSAFDLPGGNILALCSQFSLFKEFRPETGTSSIWSMSPECRTGGNGAPIYRAVPIDLRL